MPAMKAARGNAPKTVLPPPAGHGREAMTSGSIVFSLGRLRVPLAGAFVVTFSPRAPNRLKAFCQPRNSSTVSL